jgi:hypothetical protein
VIDLSHPAIQRVVEVASHKGVVLDVRPMSHSTHTAEEADTAVDAELGQIVKSVVFVAPRPHGGPCPTGAGALGSQPGRTQKLGRSLAGQGR